MGADDKTSYRDIKKAILARIRDRTWGPGTLLPGEVELAEEFGCARATVNRAMRELSEEGIIDRKRKAGTRVNLAPVRLAKLAIPLVRAEIEGFGAAYRYALVHRQVITPPDGLRDRMRLGAGEKVLHLQCLHYADDAPFQFEDRWINIAVVPDVPEADFSATGPNEWLVAKVPYTDAEMQFSAIGATPEIARHLSVAPGEAVFLGERATWLADRTVTYVRLYFHSGYKLRMTY